MVDGDELAAAREGGADHTATPNAFAVGVTSRIAVRVVTPQRLVPRVCDRASHASSGEVAHLEVGVRLEVVRVAALGALL